MQNYLVFSKLHRNAFKYVNVITSPKDTYGYSQTIKLPYNVSIPSNPDLDSPFLWHSTMSNNLHALKTTITVQWVPGHTNVPGNVLADMLAKKSTLEKPPTYCNTSLSYLKRVT
jgi:hypothetical protein